MKDVSQLCAVIAGILAISLIALAGVAFGDHTVIKLAVVSGCSMYLVQALDAESQTVEDMAIKMWIYRFCLIFWVISILAALAALMMVIF